MLLQENDRLVLLPNSSLLVVIHLFFFALGPSDHWSRPSPAIGAQCIISAPPPGPPPGNDSKNETPVSFYQRSAQFLCARPRTYLPRNASTFPLSRVPHRSAQEKVLRLLHFLLLEILKPLVLPQCLCSTFSGIFFPSFQFFFPMGEGQHLTSRTSLGVIPRIAETSTLAPNFCSLIPSKSPIAAYLYRRTSVGSR